MRQIHMGTLFVAFLVCSLVGLSTAQIDTLTILHVNDTHSHLVSFGPKDAFGIGQKGGIARAAALIGQVSATEKNVLFCHAGDAFVGDFMFNEYFGIAELQLLAQLGCDAMTLGNHEFDLTPEVLKLALTGGGSNPPPFDILSANLDMAADPALAALVQPYVIRDVGSLKVGIFGLTTEEANVFSMPAPVVITSFINGAAAAVESLRTQCNVVIALTHVGFALDSILAANIPGIDLIVGGHSHTILEDPVAVTNPFGWTTWIVQAGSFYEHVGYVKLACGPSGIAIIGHQLMPVDNSVPEVPEVAGAVGYLVSQLELDPRYGPVFSETIAEAASDIERDYVPRYKDTPMGNLVTDAYREATGADVAMAAWGFISEKLYAGPLTGADIFHVIPYGYDMATGLGFGMMTFELSGMELIMGLEYTTEQAKMIHDLYIQVSGMSFVYDSSRPLGEKFIYAVIGDEIIDPAATYTITTNSGLFGFLSIAGLQPANPQVFSSTEYEVVRDFIVDNSPVSYQIEGRIEDVSEAQSFPEGDANCDDQVSPGDALCVFWKSILGSFQEECLCQHSDLAGEVNCDGQITPGDALCIFWYAMLGQWPQDCLCSQARVAEGKAAVGSVALKADLNLKERRVAVEIDARQVSGLDAFSMQLTYPKDELEFVEIRRTDHTAAWTAFGGAVSAPGHVTLGGFHTQRLSAEESVPIATVVFRLRDGACGPCHFDLTHLTDDVTGAAVVKQDLASSSLPQQYQLAQNYPNPFNAETTIEFSVPVTSRVTVSVYNVLGQIVDVLVDAVLQPGFHQAKWNAARYGSGLYYCRLDAADFQMITKMMLLK